MGFFKDFKDDFSQAVNELLPGDDFPQDDDIQVNTLDGELDVEQELSKLDGLLEQVEKKVNRSAQTAFVPDGNAPETFAPIDADAAEQKAKADEDVPELTLPDEKEDEPEPPEELQAQPEETAVFEEATPAEEQTGEHAQPAEDMQPEPELFEEPQTDEGSILENESLNTNMSETIKEEKTMDTMDTTVTAAVEETPAAPAAMPAAPAETAKEVTDEVSLITAGTSIRGNMETTGSFEIEGKIEGDIKCNGKLTVVGSVVGNSSSSEFFADAAHVEGEVVSSGTVKIGLGSVIIGNITATSAVVAGAVKGDIDVQGPVVVDTSAVIMGNIKSRSVQINNGAVIEGFCSQCYSDVDVESLFNKNK